MDYDPFGCGFDRLSQARILARTLAESAPLGKAETRRQLTGA